MSYDATVVQVVPYQPGERRDVVAVRVKFDYAYGAAWWAEDAPGPAVGDRYSITIEALSKSRRLTPHAATPRPGFKGDA